MSDDESGSTCSVGDISLITDVESTDADEATNADVNSAGVRNSDDDDVHPDSEEMTSDTG